MIEGEDLLLCPTCGTQFDTPASNPPTDYCIICNDPRQYIPASGQAWTSLKAEAGKHETKWKQDEHDKRIWSIWAEPKLGIGQRALLLQTPHGNVLWDCIAYLDTPLIDFYEEVVEGVTAIQVGGHFDGSMVLHWDGHLFIADTFVNVPSGFYRKDRPKGTTSFSFMWSIPNMIPLPPDTIHQMWKAVKPYKFTVTHGLFPGWDIRDENVKQSVLESMKIQVRSQGFAEHALLNEE
ncbi:hypothetical protein E4T44_09481 [Aureobasidium sp. EXF-8845]|nr:hypothetical protein E4T44_09481 [Aureobasidium sp. EXF-8845]